MRHLLNKMEQMRMDLGKDLVYDFIGDILEENYSSLAEIMQECVLNRQNLDQIIEGIDKVLSREHLRLLQLAEEERLAEDNFDLPGMRRMQNLLFFSRVPFRVYARFSKEVLSDRKVAVAEGENKDYYRVEHFPKSVRDFARRNNIRVHLDYTSYRLTGNEALATDNIQLVSGDHPLFRLALALTKQELQAVALEHFVIDYQCRETLNLEIHEVCIIDGTGRELTRALLHIARRENGDFVFLDAYWLYGVNFDGKVHCGQTGHLWRTWHTHGKEHD